MNYQDYFQLYNSIRNAVSASSHAEERVEFRRCDPQWACTGSKTLTGIAMYTEGHSIPESLSGCADEQSLSDLTSGLESWNLEEASFALAAANACLNTPGRIEQLQCREPFENYCTAGIDFTGRRVGCVGHLKGILSYGKDADSIFFLERHPQPGDYPDSACDLLLPQCDIVLITGSALVNKTLPHLLELCRNAYTILTGPSVPLCPELLDFGIDRIAGMAVADQDGLRQAVREGDVHSPYRFGIPFMMKRQ